jgi:hypothetical protein
VASSFAMVAYPVDGIHVDGAYGSIKPQMMVIMVLYCALCFRSFDSVVFSDISSSPLY